MGRRAVSPDLMGAAYSPSDLQALRDGPLGRTDPVLTSPRVARRDALSVLMTFKPYVFGQSDPTLRPAIEADAD